MKHLLLRDWSGVHPIVTADPTRRKRGQSTALLDLVWWCGGKRGAW
jgi:hypothetical protein